MDNTLTNAVTIAIVGFSLVFLCLVVFAVIISILNKTDRYFTSRKKQKLEKAKAVQNNQIEIDSNIDADVIPIVAAAAYSAFGEKIRIRKINFVNPKTNENTDWSKFARTSAISTHNIRRRGK
ncbi:MAG: OadG family protein [Bacteroidetes bacterium]|nr:OadG family protein [Bacteroidota bacterium]